LGYQILNKAGSFLSIFFQLALKPVSQIHQFHLWLGYDALAAWFFVFLFCTFGGGRTAPLLPQFCSSSFFHAAMALFKAPASFNFSLKFSECRRRPVQKNVSQSS
jgi:hypothetical protein